MGSNLCQSGIQFTTDTLLSNKVFSSLSSNLNDKIQIINREIFCTISNEIFVDFFLFILRYQVLPIFPRLVDLPLEKFQRALAHILQVSRILQTRTYDIVGLLPLI